LAVAIRQALADDKNIDIGLVLVADKGYLPSIIQELCNTLNELCLSSRLLITVSVVGIDVDDDEIFENLSCILDQVPFG
jgi:hypothetical protein